MDRPDFVEQFLKRSKTILDKKLVTDIFFSGGAYQVEVKEEELGESYWPFLQLDKEGILQDAFCNCSFSEDEGYCVHLAAAYLAIFRDFDQPLHIRFEKSFWHHLFFISGKHFDFGRLKKIKEDLFSTDQDSQFLFQIELLRADARNKFLEINKESIDEHSLKFSSLTQKQIQEWKAKKAPVEVCFELSLWADLAKWVCFLQDQGVNYQVRFKHEQTSLPSQVRIQFDQIFQLECSTCASDWPSLIPSLATISSPLKVFDYKGKVIDQILYDEKDQCFRIETKSAFEGVEQIQMKKHWESEEWFFIENKGFFSKKSKLFLEKKKISKDQISTFLSEEITTLQKHLKNTTIHPEPIAAKYYLSFDENKNLHIYVFPFSYSEVKSENSAFFFPWFYIPQKGFYLLEDAFFKDMETIILKKDVSSFIHKHRQFLGNIEGFQIYFSTLPTTFSYHLTNEGDLKFNVQADFPIEYDQSLDFDEWVYIKDQGFYLKSAGDIRLLLSHGLTVKKNEVSDFISSRKEALEQVELFFASVSPVSKVGLEVKVNSKQKITVEPYLEYLPGYNTENVLNYGDYLYIVGQGFFELSGNLRLPKKYQAKVEIATSEEAGFLTYGLEKLSPFVLKLDRRLKTPKNLSLKINKILKERRKGKNYWLVNLSYVSEFGEVNLITLMQDVQAKKSYSFSNAGMIRLKKGRYKWFSTLPKKRVRKDRNLIKLTTLEWIRLCIFEEVIVPQGQSPDEIESRKLLEDLQNFETSRLLDISLLQSKLRPYQELGLQWLWFLYTHTLSGLLCDDMGLGKTHQAMALLAALLSENVTRDHKYLVICPTSVIYHWEELLKRFLPEMRALKYYGQERSLEAFEKDYDLLLTSYGILRTGKEDLKDYKFEVAIFDEIQIAKNERSQTHKALRSIRANMRLGLTGTPIENRIRELKALFELVLPSYLPTGAAFRDLFDIPIEKHKDLVQKELLSKLIRPFVLRRKKKDVLFDLPEKIEEIAYAELSDEQRKLYREVVRKQKDSLLETLQNQTEPLPYIHVFSLLSQLKQICNHPSLVLNNIRSFEKHKSGKWDLFVELVSEATNSGQKLVVFSQYLGMLQIIESYLKKQKIGFASIKGSTKNRKAQMEKFRDDPECEVFVASLLAAGIGIDLTAGSIVIHYDRWWNPAKENQATDRVHRIGQNRGVQVFKLVTRNTIEESIHSLIEKKKGLMEEVIGEDDSSQIKTLSREELIEILRRTEDI